MSKPYEPPRKGEYKVVGSRGSFIYEREIIQFHDGVVGACEFDERPAANIQKLSFVGYEQVEFTVKASHSSFAAEFGRKHQTKLPLLRTADGASHNLRNDAIYDRHLDWLLEFQADSVRIAPQGYGSYSVTLKGDGQKINFYPRFYGEHKGVSYFRPWEYDVWPDSVAGWCSWWAYLEEISLEIVEKAAAAFAKHLAPYGLNIIQVDDGYQSDSGGKPQDWLNTNKAFPGGLPAMADAIRKHRLKPGIWVGEFFRDQQYAAAHPDQFVPGPHGPLEGPWVDLVQDVTSAACQDAIVKPLYKGLEEVQWLYVKIDSIRHLLYDGYYKAVPYLASKGYTPGRALRKLFEIARDELGRHTYILACWGVMPEVAGLANACRLGTDGFGPGTLCQYNSWNNVVWRNDPDHVDLAAGEERSRPIRVAMAGAQLLLSDKVERYELPEVIEGVRRACPIPFSLPGQLYDVDPSKSDNVVLGKRNQEGGAHPGPIDADQFAAAPAWWLLEMDRPWDHWNVLGHFGDKEGRGPERFNFAEAGISPGAYAVFEFWSKTLISCDFEGFTTLPVAAGDVRNYLVRAVHGVPRVLGTSRHFTGGGPELSRVKWDGKKLSGVARVVKGEPFKVYVWMPGGTVREVIVPGEGQQAWSCE